MDKRQVNQKNSNLEREYREKEKGQDWDRKAYLMHQVLYIVRLPIEEGDMHIIQVN